MCLHPISSPTDRPPAFMPGSGSGSTRLSSLTAASIGLRRCARATPFPCRMEPRRAAIRIFGNTARSFPPGSILFIKGPGKRNPTSDRRLQLEPSNSEGLRRQPVRFGLAHRIRRDPAFDDACFLESRFVYEKTSLDTIQFLGHEGSIQPNVDQRDFAHVGRCFLPFVAERHPGESRGPERSTISS
jgi:hypothetical protein